MNTNTDEVFEFEQALKNNLSNKSTLYAGNKNVYTNEYKIDDVILGVSKQIKAMQNADCVKKHNEKKIQCKMESQFLPLNMLSNKLLKQEIQKKFETQCISDTQLIDLIQNIEAQENKSGVTQEFETTFCLKSDDIDNPEIESKESPKKCIQNTTDNNLGNYNSHFEPTVSNNNYSAPVQNSGYTNTNISFEGDGCQVKREISDVEESKLFSASGGMVKSPILGKISPIVIKSTTPFVYPLECFERFETLAHPIIEGHPNLLVAKKLINSQIENKELFIETNMDPFLKNENVVKSPVLKSNTFDKTNSEISMPTASFLEKKSQQSIIEDSILFSSDEENEHFPIEEDLPLTCPLQTSLHNYTDVLDKTMYVGFQTASNKTIQVNSDSFIMAQNILNGTEHENVAFTNPFEMFKTSNNFRNELPTENVSSYQNMDYVGFKKANGKSINISKEALSKGTELFKNIEENLNVDNNLKRQLKLNSIKSTKRFKYTKHDTKNHKYLPDQFMDENDKKLQVTETKDNKEEYLLKINDENIIQEFETNVVEEGESNIKNLQNSRRLNELKMTTLKPIQNSHQSLESTKHIFKNSHDLVITVPNNNLPGFTTASNKNISVSKKALLKCKNIFDGIDDMENNSEIKFDESDPKLRRPNGFSTASNKKIKISRKALLKSKEIFEDINIHNNLDLKNNRQVDETHLEKFVNFKTASNKIIAVSKKAFAISETIFRDISDDNVKNVKNTSNKVYKPGIELQNFRTANNKPIKVSPKSVDKYKHIFQDIDGYENNINENEIKPNIDIKSPYSNNIKMLNGKLISTCCFDMYNQKPADISDAELITNHKLLSEPKENSSLFINYKMSGFQTASMKKIEISKEKFANCLKVFDGIDLNINDELPSSISISCSFNRINTEIKPSVNSISALKSKESHFKTEITNVNKSEDGEEILGSINLGIESELNEKHCSQTKKSLDLVKCVFHTANNKPISISEEAFEASQRLIKDIKSGTEKVEGNSENSPFVGFKTGSNRNIAISKETLDKAKKIFDNIDESNNLNEAVYAHNMEKKFQFQTANNKPVNISEKSYEASQKLINPTDNVKDIVKNCEFVGFKTASNNNIAISKETFDKVKNIFDDIDEKSSINLCKKVSTPMKSTFQFQTANNKVVDVSEEAIIASQRQLNTDLNLKEFQTASNKEVQVSKTLSVTTKKVFDEIDSETVNQNKDFAEYKDINLKNILDTQVITNFEETLYTEDFLKESSPPSKRSGSPILPYSKTKKRKFKAPASKTLKNLLKTDSCLNETASTFIFDRRYKKNKGFKLKDLNILEEKYKSENINIDPYIHNFNFENILDFEFLNGRNDLTAVKLRTEDIKEIFSESVNKTIIPTGWIENHLKLILWKLLSYEIKYPNVFHKVCSAKSVIEQLKYRYDRELYNVQRPALRKILEKDDISSKTMALCVVGIYVDGVYVSSVANATETIELLLTDGWYCVKACIDKLLSKYVFEGKISVGMKLVTHGAELVNCEQGISPWEDTSSVRLKIFGNSTRRARWDARLGYHGNAAMLTQLKSVTPDGGKVSKLRVFVTRVYPTLYVEKFEDGSTVTRSERLENLYQMKYESEQQILLEKIYEDIEKEFCDQDTQDSDNIDIGKMMETGSQIARALKKHQEPAEFMATLTESQRRNLNYYTNRQNDKEIEKVQQKVREKIRNSALSVSRNVVPLMKIRVASVDKDLRVSKGMISIWRPNEELQEIITEGKWIQAYNVIPTAVRYSEIQLSASRQSIFQNCQEKDPKKNKIVGSLKRKCYLIRDLLKNPHLTTDYNEIDTVGFVFLIEPSNRDFETSKQLFQNVFLADEDKNMICINFWGGIKKFGFQNNLDVGEIVACVNLQKRSGNIMKSIPQYRAIEFSYFTKTPKYECLRKSSDALMKIFSGLDKRKFKDACVALKDNLAIFKYGNDVSPYRMNNSDYNISKNRIFIDSPLDKEANWDLSGLDFESTFKLRDTQDISPQKLLRKKKVNDKIAKLKMYGEPPPLSPLNIINTSNNAVSAFKSPLTTRNNLQVTTDDKSSTIDKENSNHESSPVLPFRKIAKRLSVNPVKLNFNNAENESNTVDPFGDDFDASLPLSLD